MLHFGTLDPADSSVREAQQLPPRTIAAVKILTIHHSISNPSSKRRSRSFQVQARTNPTHHHGRPLYLILNEDSYFSSFFGHFLVSVHLPLFVYMPLNYVAILYKSLHVFASKYYPVSVLSHLCAPSAPQTLRFSLGLLSLVHIRDPVPRSLST